jgi:phosphomannomutase
MLTPMTKLSFGTAGIRAALGPEPDQLNVDTVSAVAQALISYLQDSFEDANERGLCIGFDGRTQSDVFAAIFRDLALARGMRVRAFSEVCPTPLLAFATRLHGAAAGVMVTASHNPPSDNGVKVYWRGGGQVLPPHDAAIARRIVDGSRAAHSRGPIDAALLHSLGEEEVAKYLDAIEQLLEAPHSPRISLAYTALCGVGSKLTQALLARRPVKEFYEVAEQSVPRADFGGLTSPNPEHASALARVLALANAHETDLAVAHDPDADRLAVAARDHEGSLRVLSGDEVGALLGEHVLSKAPHPEDCLLVSTVVSSELLAQVARERGARFAQTLTGFKWIALRGRELERTDQLKFVYGYEEAIGYAFGQLGDDKDGFAALALVLELATELAASGRTLIDRLDELARTHGLFASRQMSFEMKGPHGPVRRQAAMTRLRALTPAEVLGIADATRDDFLERPERDNLLVFRSADGTRMCVRPSGTEAKLKVYLHVTTPVESNEPMTQARRRSEARLDALENVAKGALALSVD